MLISPPSPNTQYNNWKEYEAIAGKQRTHASKLL